MQCGSSIHTKRSPFRLYRPYQLELPHLSTIPSPSLFYRNPNLDILSAINRRARRLERLVSFQKILAIAQVLFASVLIVLKMLKILLAWEHHSFWDQKLLLIWEIAAPIFFVTVSLLSLCAALRPSRRTSKLAITSLVATLAPVFVFPSQSPVVSNVVDAVHLTRLIDKMNGALSVRMQMQIDEQLKRIFQFPVNAVKQEVTTTTTTTTTTTMSVHQLLSLQYLLIAFAFFSFAHTVLLIFALITYIQLLHLQ